MPRSHYTLRKPSAQWYIEIDSMVDLIDSKFPEAQCHSSYGSTLNSTRAAPTEPSVYDDLDDPQPRIEVPVVATGPIFKAIKDVTEDHLRKTFQAVVKRGGAIDLEGLIQQTVRELGFARTGKQIRQRLENSVNDLLQLGHLRWIGDRIAAAEDA